jgi:hypothetical protein
MTGTQGLRSPRAARGVNGTIIRLRGGKMRTESSSWIEEPEQVKVKIEKSTIGENRLWVGIGGLQSHTVYFMDEKLLDLLTDNLLKAKLRYIEEGKK